LAFTTKTQPLKELLRPSQDVYSSAFRVAHYISSRAKDLGSALRNDRRRFEKSIATADLNQIISTYRVLQQAIRDDIAWFTGEDNDNHQGSIAELSEVLVITNDRQPDSQFRRCHIFLQNSVKIIPGAVRDGKKMAANLEVEIEENLECLDGRGYAVPAEYRRRNVRACPTYLGGSRSRRRRHMDAEGLQVMESQGRTFGGTLSDYRCRAEDSCEESTFGHPDSLEESD
jgi:hypothetical protein